MSPERFAQVKEVFVRVCDLTDDARAAALDEQCRGDDELRREVESLLRFHSPRELITTRVGDSATRKGTSSIWKSGELQLRVGKAMKLLVSERGAKLRRWGLAAVAAVGTALVGWWSYLGVRDSLREMRAHELRLVLEGDVAALRSHLRSEQRRVRSWAQNPEFRKLVAEMTAIDPMAEDAAERWRSAPARRKIEEYLEGVAGKNVRFALWNRSLVTMLDRTRLPSDRAKQEAAAEEDSKQSAKPHDAVGELTSEMGAGVLARVFAGQKVIRTPHRDELFLGPSPIGKNDRPVMSIIVPVFVPTEPGTELTESTDKTPSPLVMAALLVRGIGTEEEFLRILQRSRPEGTGETYAFNNYAVMISESRFLDQLRALKLIPDEPNSMSSLAVHVRDPGGDLTQGYQPLDPVLSRPRTRAGLMAMSGGKRFDLDGYRDYRGVPVIGAWEWLDDLDFGVVTEIDFVEAYRPLRHLRLAFGSITGLLAVCVGLLIVSSSNLIRLRRQVQINEQLGQYTLERKIGEGGMGVVYLARHARLIRPTAVKLLRPDQLTRQTLAWFEREVRLASTLSHPNTIQIYDYGQTDDGIFYYAMEFIDGYSLEELIEIERTLNVARTVHVLRQVCLSLHEAHSLGLIHRDIKPHNIMLCERGGEADVVKVLDFGLAKDLGDESPLRLTSTGAFAGTPMYMSPERLRDPSNVDARCDLYAVGAVAFRLLTGRDVYDGASSFEILSRATSGSPPRPSDHATQPIPDELDSLIHSCLADDPGQRPASASEFLLILNSLALPDRWGQSDAQRWWNEHRRRSSG